MRFAYADPPYVGQAKKHYGKEDSYAGEVDHAVLIERLCGDYPDGWALSASSPSLREILPLCPEDVRVAAWVKPFAVFKPNVNPAYAWEPVIFRGGRKRDRKAQTVRDWMRCNITLRRGLPGVKPMSSRISSPALARLRMPGVSGGCRCVPCWRCHEPRNIPLRVGVRSPLRLPRDDLGLLLWSI